MTRQTAHDEVRPDQTFHAAASRQQKNVRWLIATCLIAAVLAVGCSSSSDKKVATSPRYEPAKPARPGRILVYDFAVLRADVPADAPSRLRMAPEATDLPNETRGRDFGSNMTARLIAEFKQMGFAAERGSREADWRANDVIVRGYLISQHVEKNTNWYVVGVDLGASEIMALVESFQVTPQGLGRGLGAGNMTDREKELAERFEMPGNAKGRIVTSEYKISGSNDRENVKAWSDRAVQEIAARFKKKFEGQGWMTP